MRLRQVLELPCLQKAQVIAGIKGLEKCVRLVNVLEVPDIYDWTQEDSLIFTTAYPFREDPRALGNLIEKLHLKSVSGLAIKLGRFVDHLTAETIQLADELGFPIISLPADTQFDHMIVDVLSAIIAEQTKTVRPIEQTASADAVPLAGLNPHQLMQRAIEGASVQEVISLLGQELQTDIRLYNAREQLVAQFVLSEEREVNHLAEYSKPIVLENQSYGKIIFLSPGLFFDGEQLQIIEIATVALLMILMKNEISIFQLNQATGKSSKRKQDEFIRILRRFRQERAESGEPFFCCILIQAENSSQTLSSEQMCRYFKKLETGLTDIQIKFFSFNWEGGLYVALFLPDDKQTEMVQKLFHLFEQELKSDYQDVRMNFRISRFYSETLLLSEAIDEANMVRDAKELQLNEPIRYYFEIINGLLIGKIPLDDKVMHLIYRMIYPLIRYDRENKTELFQTLIYLLHADTNAEVAEKSYIHHKTLSYRIKRIGHILSADMSKKTNQSLLLTLCLIYLSNQQVLDQYFQRQQLGEEN